MTRLGYNKRETKHMYLSEFIDKYKTYKNLFNLEKTSIYVTESNQNHSLKDF